MPYENQSTQQRPVRSAAVGEPQSHELHPLDDLLSYARCYAREKPQVTALVCLGIGFVLGWRLKPW